MRRQPDERLWRNLQLLCAIVLAACAIYLCTKLIVAGRAPLAAERGETNPSGWGELASNGLAVGDPGAVHTVVVFTDYMCEFCRVYEGVLENVRLHHTADVKIIYYLFPLRTIHPGSERIGLSVLCAARQAGFESLHYELMRRDAGVPVELMLDSLAREVVSDPDQYYSCLDSRESFSELAEHMRLGMAHDLRLLPAVFVDGLQFPVAPSEQALLDLVTD